MALAIREADPASDREEILDIVERNFSASLDRSMDRLRYEWLYRQNPAGKARTWLVYETGTGQSVGAASMFPRFLWLGETKARCGLIGDFAVDRKYRSLGPALMLQRAAFYPVENGELEVSYDCPPHDQGMATFRRLGMNIDCQMHRYARLLRADDLIARFFGAGYLAWSIAGIANWLLGMRLATGCDVRGVKVALESGPFGEEFSELDRRLREKNIVRGYRAAEVLNWRYRADPLHKYRVLTARGAGELIAYVVLGVSGKEGRVVDIFGSLVGGIGRLLLEAVADQLRADGVETLQAIIPRDSELCNVLRGAGFRFRMSALNVVAYARPECSVRACIGNPPKWELTFSDVSAFARRI